MASKILCFILPSGSHDKSMRHLITFLATGCYAGKIPVAPGTWGTVVGVLFYLLIGHLSLPIYIVTTLALIAVGIWVSGFAQKIFENEDPPQVVIDEIAGFLVTMTFHEPKFWAIVLGFFLFRLFDIVKPFPVNWIENKFRDGRGIVLDDVFAGVYANIVLSIMQILLSVGAKN